MDRFDRAFWEAADALVRECEVVVDRPGQEPGMDYYGYLAGTAAQDGEGVDVWLGSLQERRVTGVVLTIGAGFAKREAELKLLVGCTADEAQRAVSSHRGLAMSDARRAELREQGLWGGVLLVTRPDGT